MNCLTCHQPHSGAENGMLVKDQAPNMDFCRKCHSNPLDLNQMSTTNKFLGGGKRVTHRNSQIDSRSAGSGS